LKKINMYNLHRHLWIAISASTLAIMSSDPVLAKPLARSKPMITSQVTTKAAATDSVSRQPIEAILANVKLNPSSQPKAGRVSSPPVAATRTIKATRRNSTDRSLQGVGTFTNSDRVQDRPNNFSPIDRWTD
jgi:hypothetical protein